jgi:hypothetical protein
MKMVSAAARKKTDSLEERWWRGRRPREWRTEHKTCSDLGVNNLPELSVFQKQNTCLYFVLRMRLLLGVRSAVCRRRVPGAFRACR